MAFIFYNLSLKHTQCFHKNRNEVYLKVAKLFKRAYVYEQWRKIKTMMNTIQHTYHLS